MSWVEVLRDGFEGGFEDWNGIGELTVPEGWRPKWREGQGEPGIDWRPECDREVVRVRSGQAAAKMCSAAHSSHTGALVRRVNVTAGDRVRVVAWGANFREKTGHGIRVGIDPWGGTDFESEEVEWSSWWSQYDKEHWVPEQFVELSAVAEAQSNQVTVFLYSHSDYKGTTIAAYWDDVRVEVWREGDEPGPDPEPGPGPGDEELAAAVAALSTSVDKLATAVYDLSSMVEDLYTGVDRRGWLERLLGRG